MNTELPNSSKPSWRRWRRLLTREDRDRALVLLADDLLALGQHPSPAKAPSPLNSDKEPSRG